MPNLMRAVAGYAAHERATLVAVTDARTAAIAALGTHGGLRALFAGDHLLLLLPTYRNRFEASLYEPVTSHAQLASFFADVSACLAIVDALNLNTRVWSKT